MGLCSNPEIEHFELVHLDKFIIIASDGLWDVMESREAIQFVENEVHIREKAAETLAEEARRRWGSYRSGGFVGDDPKAETDDISVIVVYLNFMMNEKSSRGVLGKSVEMKWRGSSTGSSRTGFMNC